MKLIAVVIILLSVVFVIGILVNKKKSAGVTAISQVFEAVSGPLHLDAGYAGPGDVKEVQHLLKDGVDVNVRDQHGRTLLMRAHSDNLEMIQTLLNAGVDVNAKDSLGNTALM